MSTTQNTEKTILPDPHPVGLGDLRKVIPKHCFERSYVTSFRYIIQDILGIAACILTGTYLIPLIPLITVRILCWTLLFITQGALMTGLWVIAHECGHQAFSPSLFVNDTVGCILHTMLLVPYWSWKYTHGQHHSNTDSMQRDSVFVPYTSEEIENKFTMSVNRGNPLSRLIGIVRMSLIGWFVYLLFDVSGPRNNVKGKGNSKSKGWVSHFNPFCTLFNQKRYQMIGVIGSDVALIVWCYLLYRMTCATDMWFMIKFYWIPYLNVNHWLVTITFLQHTDVNVPRYQPEAWTWLRGALGTVDRDYGIFNIFHHHIADTHVLHHIFSKIPHYHAQEATKALLNSHLIDDYYLHDDTSWYIALWKSYRDCWFVPHDEEIAYFKSSREYPKKMN